VHIRVKKGLDIPIVGGAEGEVVPLPPAKQIALDLSSFPQTRFKLLVKTGDRVQIGQHLALDKGSEGRAFVSPAGGTVVEIRRGLKRRLLSVVIEREVNEEWYDHGSLAVERASREEIIDKLKGGGLFAHIRMRRFDVWANPTQTPRDIFVRAIESAPFLPSAELQVEGHEREFQTGLDALAKLTSGRVHLVHRLGSHATAFTQAKGVEIHTAEGPHPISSPSLHIHRIARIEKHDEVVWTVSALDVLAIGKLLESGRYYPERVVAIAGTGVLPERRQLVRLRAGTPVEQLLAVRNSSGKLRFI